MKAEVARARKKLGYQQKKQRERRELNPTLSVQPTQRGLRYSNPRSAMAEEGLIRLLHLDATIFGDTPPLTQEDFSNELLGRIFFLLWEYRSSPHPLNALAGQLSGDEMSHLTAILQKPESTANAQKAMADYIATIKHEVEKRTGGEIDPLVQAMERNKAKKGYGGK